MVLLGLNGSSMAKHEDNAIIVFLCIVICILSVVLFFLLLRFMTLDSQLLRNKREVDKAIVLLREEREKFKEKKDGREP
jgi:predicted Holliday junction resolvase-like endonuclease